jgi:hypothetical protein
MDYIDTLQLQANYLGMQGVGFSITHDGGRVQATEKAVGMCASYCNWRYTVVSEPDKTPLATSKSPTFGHPKSPRQDG